MSVALFSIRSISYKCSQIISRCYSQNAINLSNPVLQKYLQHLMTEYDNLASIPGQTPEELRRLHNIKPIVHVLEQRVFLFDGIDSLKDLNKTNQDVEMKKMIKSEAEIYLTKLKEIDDDLIAALLRPTHSDGGVLIEIVAGAGGQESMLFARELFDMYIGFAEYKGWPVDIASIDTSDLGGIRKASLLMEGVGVPEMMKLEAGVHRVQRIPKTEKSGRIHTSTATVAVLPQPTNIELRIADKDLEIETKRASGAGGQHVNTTDSAVRIVHLPTGTVVECQEGRSQIKNKDIAMQKLRTLLLQKETEHRNSGIRAERKSQVGTGERNEKIRTYNYPQDRITEHRPGGITVHNIKNFMLGNEQLEQVQEELLNKIQYDNLLEEIKKFSIESEEMDVPVSGK